MRTAYVVITDTEVTVRACYDCGQTIKAETHGRRWNPEDKVWRIPIGPFDPPGQLGIVLEIVHDFHPDVIINDLRTPKQKPPPFTPPPPPMRGSWADEMFKQLPTHLRTTVFRALVKVLHPDVGGDTNAAQTLNDAYSRVLK